jgi:hypothetical protein
MSQFITTKQIHQEIERISTKYNLNIVVLECPYSWHEKPDDTIAMCISDPDGYIVMNENGDCFQEGYDYPNEYLCPALKPENITELLLDLSGLLGENPNFRFKIKTPKQKLNMPMNMMMGLSLSESIKDSLSEEWDHISIQPQTQAKALSDKWFSVQETDGKATPSLWSTNPEQVLEELLEILKRL